MNTIYFGHLSNSKFFAWSDQGVIAVSSLEKEGFLQSLSHLSDGNPIEVSSPPATLQAQTLESLKKNSKNVSLDLTLLPIFQRKVLEVVSTIPPGEVKTYGEVAALIGHPGAARAVGTALANNPLPHIIPCHRVIRSDGKIGQYSDGGSKVKELLLNEEKLAHKS